MNLSTNLEESDTVKLFILSLELVVSIDIPLKEKKKRYKPVKKPQCFMLLNTPSHSLTGLNQEYKKARNVLIIVC